MENALPTIKLIAIDIDGTLLTPQGQITPRTRAAIRAAQHAGVIVTLATARRYIGAQAVAEALDIELPLIVYDGTMIVSHPTRTIMACQTLSADLAWQTIELFLSHNIQPIVHPCESESCVKEEVWTGPAEYDNPGLASYIMVAGERVQRMSYAVLKTRATQALRTVAFTGVEVIERILPALAALNCGWNFAPMGSYGSAELAILPTGCSKASGVVALAAHYQIPLEQVMTLGDSYNDLEMLRVAGLGIAMGQAPEQVKAAAKAITASNQDEGVALAIERYVLSAYPQKAQTQTHKLLAETTLLKSFNILS